MLVAEVKAMKAGLEYCSSNNLLPLMLETDSLSLKKIVEGLWEVPWTITIEVKRIKQSLASGGVVVEHTVREGNKLSEFFANLIFCFVGTQRIHYTSIQEVPAQGKAIISLEKSKMPNLRIQKCQNKDLSIHRGTHPQANTQI